jgi:hypothetical protein
VYQLVRDRLLVFLEFEPAEEVALVLHAALDQLAQLLVHLNGEKMRSNPIFPVFLKEKLEVKKDEP